MVLSCIRTRLTLLILNSVNLLLGISTRIEKVDNKAIAKKGLEELGPMSFREKALSVLFVIALFGWIFSNSLHINATIVAIIVMVLCIVLSIVTWDDILKKQRRMEYPSMVWWYHRYVSFA